MKRNRAPNFTTAEIMHLLRLVEKYPVIENKKTDAATTSDKQFAWRALADEYNSSTAAGPRTPENLMACYKNQKIKVKKQHSNEKMTIKAPSIQLINNQAGPSHCNDIIVKDLLNSSKIDIEIVHAVEEMGQDWEKISQSTNIGSQECEAIFKTLVKRAKKEDSDYKKEMNCTGGGPTPQPKVDPITEKVKVLMGPSLEGLYTIYGGDADFMHQQQELLPQKKINPIDLPSTSYTPAPAVNDIEYSSPVSSKAGFPKRLGLLKKKVDPALNDSTEYTGKKKKMANTFVELAEDKKEYIQIKKNMAEEQLVYERKINTVNLEILEEKLKFDKKFNVMELDHQQKLKELELQFLKQKYELELNLLKNKL